MEKQKIDRINALAGKSRTEGLTPEEKTEQQRLREEYIAEYRENLRAQLEHTVVVNPDGSRRPLRKKPYHGLRQH